MPPKVRFTREEIIRAALDITRESGPEALTARSLAARLDCSAKPIFGLFRSMDEVQQEVLKAGYQFYGETIARAMESGEYPPYKASGMAYIDFARRAGKLSGGWQRRLSIAMALVARPEILFLDEPTLGLDVLARAELWDVIRALKGRITVILTTHYMEEAEALSDRVGVMKDGRLLALGTPEELKVRTGCEKFEDAFIAIVKGAGK